MKYYYDAPTQFELFPGSGRRSAPVVRQRVFLNKLTVPVENFVILGIIVIMGLVTTFCLGVERGRKVIAKETRPVTAAVNESTRFSAPKPAAGTRPVPRQFNANVGQRTIGPITDLNNPKPAAIPTVKVLAKNNLSPVEKAVNPVPAGKSYTVQIASYKTESYAQARARELNGQGHQIFVMPKGSYSIICVGKFPQANQAKVLSQRLKKVYKDCLVRSL